MALTFVQSGDTGFQSSGATSTMLPANVTVGNAVALFVWVNTYNALTSVTSPIGTFTRVAQVVAYPQQGEWWVCNSATAAGNTVTINASGIQYAAQATEWSGGVAAAIGGGNNSGTGTAVSQTVTPTTSGDVILVGTSQFYTITTYPSSPWTNYNAGFFTSANGEAASWITTTSTSSVTANYVQSTSAAWNTVGVILSQTGVTPPGGSLTSTFSASAAGTSGAASYSGTGSLSASFSGVAYSGTSGIPSLPLLSVQIAFNPTNIQSTTQTWTDVTPYVRNLNSRLGRQHYLDRVEPGSLSMVVNNRTGFFLNGGATSTGGNGTGYVIQPRIPIRVTATWPVPGGTPYPIFYGIIDDISENITDEINSDMTIRATDMTKFLSLQYMSSNNFWNTYAKSASATNWFRCDLTRQATVTSAVTPSVVFGAGYTDYTSINNFAVTSPRQYVAVKGLTSFSGGDQNTQTNSAGAPVYAANGSSFTLYTGNTSGLAGGSGTATQTDTYDQINTGGVGSYIGAIGFNPNGAMVYSNNGSISLSDGSNAPSGWMEIDDVPSGTSGALDFWILGQGIANQQITTVLAGSTTNCQLWVSNTGKLQAVAEGISGGSITDASSNGTEFTFTGTFNVNNITLGDYVRINGMTAAYNGDWKVTAKNGVSGSTFTTLKVSSNSTPAAIHGRSGLATPIFRTNAIVNDGYWHHVGFCNDSAGQLNVYADGFLTPIITSGGTSFNGWTTGNSLSPPYGTIPLIIGAGNATLGDSSSAASLAGLIDEVIISNNSNYAGSGLLNELLNRYKAGTLLTQGFPVTSTPVLSGDRIAEILCIAGFGAIGTTTAGEIKLNPNMYYINDSGTPWVNGLSTNGFTSVEPYYWDSPVTDSTALDLIRQICDTDIGSFFQEPNGTFSFYNQNYYGTWSWNSLTNTGSWTPNNVYVPAPTGDHIWTDDASSTYHYYGPSLQVVRDDVDTWTTVKVSPQSGTAQTYENFANESRWGYTTLTKSATLHTTLSLALSTATFLGNLFKTPLPRVTNVELRSETLNGANMTALLNTEFGDIVTFKRTSPNASTTGTYPSSKGQISTNMVVEYISHDFQAEPGFWHTSFILDPYPIRS